MLYFNLFTSQNIINQIKLHGGNSAYYLTMTNGIIAHFVKHMDYRFLESSESIFLESSG